MYALYYKRLVGMQLHHYAFLGALAGKEIEHGNLHLLPAHKGGKVA